MLTDLFSWRAFYRPSKVTAGTMAPMESVNWLVGTWVCSHWLCGQLVQHWPCTIWASWLLDHGVRVLNGVFATSHPTNPTPPRPTPPRYPTHPPPLLVSRGKTIFIIFACGGGTTNKNGKNGLATRDYTSISHTDFRKVQQNTALATSDIEDKNH